MDWDINYWYNFQVTRYLQPPLPSPALSLLCNPPTPKLSTTSHLARFPSHLKARSLSTSYSLNEACTLANPSPESYQSVFSTSPDFAFPPTPSSSPPLISQPCARPASESVGFPTPPDSVPRKSHDHQLCNLTATRRRIFEFPCTSSERALQLPPPLYQPFTVPPPPPFHLPPPPSSSYPPQPALIDRPPPSYWGNTGIRLCLIFVTDGLSSGYCPIILTEYRYQFHIVKNMIFQSILLQYLLRILLKPSRQLYLKCWIVSYIVLCYI